MERLSPITRRIVAVGLLILLSLVGLEWVVLPLATGIADRREELSELRARRAKLAATIAQILPPATIIPPGLAMIAADRATADAQLHALLAGSAAIAAVPLQQIGSCIATADPQLACSDISTSGSEAQVAAFISTVEHGTPAIRFQQWRIVRGNAADTVMTFSGLAIAAWEAPS